MADTDTTEQVEETPALTPTEALAKAIENAGDNDPYADALKSALGSIERLIKAQTDDEDDEDRQKKDSPDEDDPSETGYQDLGKGGELGGEDVEWLDVSEAVIDLAKSMREALAILRDGVAPELHDELRKARRENRDLRNLIEGSIRRQEAMAKAQTDVIAIMAKGQLDLTNRLRDIPEASVVETLTKGGPARAAAARHGSRVPQSDAAASITIETLLKAQGEGVIDDLTLAKFRKFGAFDADATRHEELTKAVLALQEQSAAAAG